jgi:hypothetical protein
MAGHDLQQALVLVARGLHRLDTVEKLVVVEAEPALGRCFLVRTVGPGFPL